MKHDSALIVLAFLLALLALPAAGWIDLPILPAAPWDYLPLALGLTALVALGVAPDGASRVLTILVGASPFVAFGVLGSPPGAAIDMRWLAFAALALFVALLPQKWRRGALGGGVALFLGGSVLGAAGLFVVPRGWTPLLAQATASAPAAPARPGVRAGTPVRPESGERVPAAGGAGPWWVMANEAQRAGPRPHVLVLDGAFQLDPAWRLQGLTAWGGNGRRLDGAFDFEPFDAVIVTETAWETTDAQAGSKARALADYVRGGGLLIGPGPELGWPEGLGRALGAAGSSSSEGKAGARVLGHGTVVRAQTKERMARALLEDDLWVREVTSIFHGGRRPAVLPEVLGRWQDDPAPRKPVGVLLLLVALALTAFQWLLTGWTQRVGVALVAASGLAALVWVVPVPTAIHTAGLRLDFGGPGGRRVEAVWLSAGPTGYVGSVAWQGGGYVRTLGGTRDAQGRLHLEPGATAWALRDGQAGAPPPEDRESREAGFMLRLLRGTIDPARVRLGRGPKLPVSIEGASPVTAWTLRLRPRNS